MRGPPRLGHVAGPETDLAEAFAAHPGSREQWDAFPRSTRRAMLAWIVTATRPETRARRIVDTAAKAAIGRRAQG